jgi:hypothetical protein
VQVKDAGALGVWQEQKWNKNDRDTKTLIFVQLFA